MRSTKWILLFFLQISSTVSESETEETSPAISWIQTDTVSFYLELISLVYGSCDLNSEKTADIKLACSHLTNATHSLRTFLAPLSDILPTTDQVNLLQKKMLQSGIKDLSQKKAPIAPKVYMKITRAIEKMHRLIPEVQQGDEILLSLFAKEDAGLDLLQHGTPLDLSAIMTLNVLVQSRFLRKETGDWMKWLKTLMLIGLVPQALVLILMIYHYAKVQRHARASKKRLHRAARDTELLDRLQSRIGQDLVVAN